MKFIITLFLLLTTALIPAFGLTLPQKKFITIADIHFNPFIGCDQFTAPCPILSELQNSAPEAWDSVFQKYADKIQTSYYHDTNYQLLNSTLTELGKLNQQDQPAFILLLGDFLAHQFPEQYKQYSNGESGYQEFTKKTLQYLTYKFNQAAPTANFYPALGNNDSYEGNYKVESNGNFLNDFTGLFSALIKNKDAREKFSNEFSNAGYYAVTLNKNQKLIVLDSVLFSNFYSSTEKQKAAEEQLTWLQNQLNTAKEKQQRVLIALHVPPGIDVYLTLKMHFDVVRYFVHPLFWKTTYNQRLLTLLKQYSNVIAGILPAHIHDDSFQLISHKSHEIIIPSSITPSISPIYGNNPGLKVFSYNDQTFQLLNFRTYFYPLDEPSPAWKLEYDFNNIYQPNCKRCLLITGMLNLKENNGLMDSYKKYYAVSRNAQPITTKSGALMYYWCGIHNTDWESYKACAAS